MNTHRIHLKLHAIRKKCKIPSVFLFVLLKLAHLFKTSKRLLSQKLSRSKRKMNQMDVCPEAAFVQKIQNTATVKTAFINSYTITVYCQRGEICLFGPHSDLRTPLLCSFYTFTTFSSELAVSNGSFIS